MSTKFSLFSWLKKRDAGVLSKFSPDFILTSITGYVLLCFSLHVLHSAAFGDEGIQRTAKHDTNSLEASSASLNKDKYSGKTIVNQKMALDIVRLRESNAPRVGEVAPEFTLTSVSGKSNISLKELHRDKPVALIMASWGCSLFRQTVPGLKALHERYKDKVNFVMIYTREGHAIDGYDPNGTGKVKDPQKLEERVAIAMTCREEMELPFSILVDSMSDQVMTRWAAMPIRVFVVGMDGKVDYAGRQGPWGYRPYKGYQHGNGELIPADFAYSPESLEVYLEKRYPSNSSPMDQSNTDKGK